MGVYFLNRFHFYHFEPYESRKFRMRKKMKTKTFKKIFFMGLVVLAFVITNSPYSFSAVQNVDVNEAFGADGTPIIDGVAFSADVTLSVADGDNFGNNGGVSADAGGVDNRGTIDFAGSSVVSGKIGELNERIKAINLNGAAGKTVQVAASNGLSSHITTTTVAGTGTLDLDGDLNGTTLNYTADGLVTLADTKNITLATGITTSANSQGTLTIEGTSTIGGQVGANGAALKVVNAGAAGKTVDFGNNVFATTANVTGEGGTVNFKSFEGILDFDADGTATISNGATLTGTVTTQTNNTGTFTMPDNGTVTGQVGTDALKLKVVNGAENGGTSSFNSDVFATTTNVGLGNVGTGTLDLNGTLKGTTLVYSVDGFVTLADNKDIDLVTGID